MSGSQCFLVWRDIHFFMFYAFVYAKLALQQFIRVLNLGARDVFKVQSPDEVFDTLERLLWDHANKVKE